VNSTKTMMRAQAMEYLTANIALLEIYALEKENIDEIVNQALNYPLGANRWPAYSALKQQANLLAGWNAFLFDVSSSQHYTVLLEFIDFLLPQAVEEIQEDTDTDEYKFEEDTEQDVDNVSLYVDGWFQHSQEILIKLEEQRELLQSPKTESKADMDQLIGVLSRNVGNNETEN
jgi:hypothetical protein